MSHQDDPNLQQQPAAGEPPQDDGTPRYAPPAAPSAPQYPAQPAPQYSAPTAPQYAAPPAPQYAAPAVQPYGAAYSAPAAPQYAAQTTNVLAIISLITSIVGLSIVGVILGHIGLSQIKRNGEGGRGLALAGLIIGYIGIGLVLLWLIWIIFIMVAAGSAASSSYYYD